MLQGEEENMSDDYLESLQEAYHWGGHITKTVVPGFSEDYNSCQLIAFHENWEKPCRNSKANRTASYIMMRDSDICKGNFVFCALKYDKENHVVGHIGISRRDILNIAEYSHICSSAGAVPARIHFENIRRREALIHLKSENFQMLPEYAI